jgi:hypothetical protein
MLGGGGAKLNRPVRAARAATASLTALPRPPDTTGRPAAEEPPFVITEHCRFQLEASKLGREVVFQVTVFQKEERRRTRLFAATQCSDPFHFLIQFIIREAPDFQTLLARFVHQLEHRGFEPERMRMRGAGKWEPWTPVPRHGGADTSEAAAAAAARLSEVREGDRQAAVDDEALGNRPTKADDKAPAKAAGKAAQR